MIGRKQAPAFVHAPADTKVVAENVPMREAECFKPSSFSTRRAKADEDFAELSQRRLASLGKTEFAQRNVRSGEVEYLDAELFYNVDKPNERFVQIVGVAGMHALHSVSGKEESVTPIPGKVRTRGPGALTVLAPSDPPPRPV